MLLLNNFFELFIAKYADTKAIIGKNNTILKLGKYDCVKSNIVPYMYTLTVVTTFITMEIME